MSKNQLSQNLQKAQDLTDEELSPLAQNGDENAVNTLLKKYKSLVNQIARSYFLTGGDMEDIVQEGMIGLYKAVMNYKAGKSASFKTFASTCIKHQVQSAVRVASSEKNRILSTALPIIDQLNSEDEDEKEIIFPSDLPSPDETLIEKERLNEIVKKIKDVLSEMELKVLVLYLKGYSYNEIANIENISKKSIDNALSRIKNKLAFLRQN